MKVSLVQLVVILSILAAFPIISQAQSLRGVLDFLGLEHEDDNDSVSSSRNSITTSESASSASTITASQQLPQRRTEDFLAQAQEEKAEEDLGQMEEDGDPDDVAIVSDENDIEEEDEMLEDEEALIDEALVEDEGYTEDDLILLRRKFVSYEPSPWEVQWMDQIDDIMAAQSLCRTLLSNPTQREKLHQYMDMLCATRLNDEHYNWCFFSDFNQYFWYNSDNHTDFEIYMDYTPDFLRDQDIPEMQGVLLDDDTWESIASKFTYHDDFTGEDYVEYIEPLISHLRFPLAECLEDQPFLMDFAGFVIPPKFLDRTDGRKLIYDVGSPDWSRMRYVTEHWALNGIHFDFIGSYATATINPDDDEFPKTVPESYADRVFRHYFPLTDQPPPQGADGEDDNNDINPDAIFLPETLRNQTVGNDYVVVKLDHADAAWKDSILDYILSVADDESLAVHIDELIVELNPSNAYVMAQYLEEHVTVDDISGRSLGDIYRTLGALRQKGIRAHAWVS